ncbi:MAG TPA: hypothetical protein VFH95_09035 [Candidatus Kapabacteria bacterium]|nr:hypothetical protein [Candidatus Kapabacteria bacterium]
MIHALVKRKLFARNPNQTIREVELQKELDIEAPPILGGAVNDNGHALQPVKSIQPNNGQLIITIQEATPLLSTLEELIHTYLAQGWQKVPNS